MSWVFGGRDIQATVRNINVILNGLNENYVYEEKGGLYDIEGNIIIVIGDENCIQAKKSLINMGYLIDNAYKENIEIIFLLLPTFQDGWAIIRIFQDLKKGWRGEEDINFAFLLGLCFEGFMEKSVHKDEKVCYIAVDICLSV